MNVNVNVHVLVLVLVRRLTTQVKLPTDHMGARIGGMFGELSSGS